MAADYDVYSYGVVASSTLYACEGRFPEAEGYAEITGAQHMTGGEATNSSIILSRLGARVRLDGNWIGDDAAGRRTKAILDGHNIDTTRLPLTPDYAGVHEVVIAAANTRTIFGAYVRLQETESWNTPIDDDIRRAKVVCLDPFFKAASAHAAQVAGAAGIPAVTVDCRHDNPILGDVAAVVVSESFIREQYPGQAAEDLLPRYLQAMTGLVIFTFGDRESWYARRGETATQVPAHAVDTIDTSGAGDAFRAGIVFGYLQGWDDARTVEFASALAAIVCTRTPGVADPPNLAEVNDFLRERGASPGD